MNTGVVESTVEDAALTWFHELGYAIVHGPEIAPGELFAERQNYGGFHQMLVEGVTVSYQRDGETAYDQVNLLDFNQPANNDWAAINQFTIIENRSNRRPDILVFINGLPLGIIELKNIGDENATIKGAFNQLQ